VIIDVGEATFATEVLERSRTVPVVVDFWAGWCAPCRALGPVLEAAVERRDGEVVLARVDVDANPGLQRAYGVRAIPAVKAFRDGRLVAEFTGAQPKTVVERFLDGLVPSPADRLAVAGDETSLLRAIELEHGHVGARTRLGRLLLERGDLAGAVEVLTPVEHDPVAAGLLARARLAGLEDAPPRARAALSALDQDDRETALNDLVATVREVNGEVRELARLVAVGLFAELGNEHPLTEAQRPRLAAALY